MGFTFQQPGSTNLIQAIGTAAKSADRGIGVFAFASAGGVKAFFDIPDVHAMLAAKKPFHLVVGVDAITNAEALLSIDDLRGKYGAQVLSAEVFFHGHSASTFHPKFVQFKKGDELNIITGSGNLTSRGLGVASVAIPPPGNWEAFSTQTLTGAEAEGVSAAVDSWLQAHRVNKMLRRTTDETIKSKAMANGLVRYTSTTARLPPFPAVAKAAEIEATADDYAIDAKDILVRELPKNRPGQADIGKEALSDFFGYAGKAKSVLLQHVTLDDKLDKTESIRLFVNDSQNYRLELHAMAGLPYKIGAKDSRMILVATRLDRRSFRYTVVPVDTDAHKELLPLLGVIPKGRRLMRERRLSASELREGWRMAPSNLIPVLAGSPPV